jgi:uncharacterized protein YndB with AHSA1/START domain
MTEPRNHVRLTGDFAASPDEVFTYFTERFGEIWAGRMEEVGGASDPNEPFGLGFVRIMHSPLGKLREEIVTHERPSLIEYKVIDPDASFRNHLGRIELAGDGSGGTHVLYTVDFDYKPAFLGPAAAGVMRLGWATRGRRKLRSALG